jgi:hypothetical protein
MLATAGMVESRVLEPENMRSLARGNATRTEFDPGPITPEFIDHLKKVGASEKLIQKVERQQLAQQNPGRRLQAIPGSNPVCLDVSGSSAKGTLASSIPDTGLPGTLMHVEYDLAMVNNCPVTVENPQIGVVQSVECPQPTIAGTNNQNYNFQLDPSSLPIEFEAVPKAGQSTTAFAGCIHYDTNGVPDYTVIPTQVTANLVGQAIGPGDTSGTAQYYYSGPITIPVEQQ